MQKVGRKTSLIGVLNITPDSFSDGGLYNTIENALIRVETMLSEGADSIDIGGESTRPGSKGVNQEEELNRILPVLKAIRRKFGNELTLSIDTNKAEVARMALAEGANLINSLGGFTFDPALADVISEYTCPIIIYHIRGMPETMQSNKIVYKNVIEEISAFFTEQISFGTKHGIRKEQFLLDPGIGFGKTVENNLEIIRQFDMFQSFGLPLVVGVSRKSHLGKILQETFHLHEPAPISERVEAGLAETAVAVLKGASFVRTHDVLQTKRFLAVLDKLIVNNEE